MQIVYTKRTIKSIELLPLINVVFLLILFVLIAGRPTTRHPQGIEVAFTQQQTSYEARTFVVHLRSDNQFYLADAQNYTLPEIIDKMRATHSNTHNIVPELIADKAAHASALLAFRQAAGEIGIETIYVKTRYQPSP